MPAKNSRGKKEANTFLQILINFEGSAKQIVN